MPVEDKDHARLAEAQRKLPRPATPEDVARHLGFGEPLPEVELVAPELVAPELVAPANDPVDTADTSDTDSAEAEARPTPRRRTRAARQTEDEKA